MRTQLIDIAWSLRAGFITLALALAIRTYIEWGIYQRNKLTSSGFGLTELPVRINVFGDQNTLRIITRAKETGFAFYEVEETASLKSSGFINEWPGSQPPYRLRRQNKTATVVSGSFMYLLDKDIHEAHPGDTVTFPAGSTHTWWVGNSTEGKTVVRFKVEPAGEFGEAVYESLSGFSRDYGSLAETPYLQMMVWAARQGLDLMFLPAPVRLTARLIGPTVGGMFGYTPTYKKYNTA